MLDTVAFPTNECRVVLIFEDVLYSLLCVYFHDVCPLNDKVRGVDHVHLWGNITGIELGKGFLLGELHST